jgi:transcription elongation factor Elf1
MGRGKGPVIIKNLPKNIATDANIGLGDEVQMLKYSLEEKAFLIGEFEQLSTHVFPENKVLRHSMLTQDSSSYTFPYGNMSDHDRNSGITATPSRRFLAESTPLPAAQSDCEKKTVVNLPKPIKLSTSFKCPLCTYESQNNSNVHKHIKTHFKDKKVLTCNVCGISMTDPSNFKVHSKRHINKDNFACDICGKKFVAKCNLLQHKKNHEEGKVRYTGRCMLPRCKDYKREFKHLLLHLKKAHSLFSLEVYKEEVLKELSDLQSGKVGHPCSCVNHQRWIQRLIGDRHSCYLCECSLTWELVPTVLNGTTIWMRKCKYALHVTSELVANSKLNF